MDKKRLVDGTTALAEKRPRVIKIDLRSGLKMCGCGSLPTLVSAQTPRINSIPLPLRTATTRS